MRLLVALLAPSLRLTPAACAADSAGPATTLGTIWKHYEYLEFVPYLE